MIMRHFTLNGNNSQIKELMTAAALLTLPYANSFMNQELSQHQSHKTRAGG